MNNKEKTILNRGPKPAHLRIEGISWESAVEKALQKKRPLKGWPKEKKKK